MNNKGFMMAEVVVVASIVLVTLVGLYTSYNKIFSIYNKRVDYYDVANLYDLAYIRDGVDFNSYSSKSLILNETYRKVYYVNKNDLKILSVTNKTFDEYLDFIADSVTFETDNIVVMEKCLNSNKDNCKYAYLEVFN